MTARLEYDNTRLALWFQDKEPLLSVIYLSISDVNSPPPDTTTDFAFSKANIRGDGRGHRRLRRPVERPEGLEDGLKRAFAHHGPALVDVVTARQELAMPPKITVGEAADFSLFALKAVMDGRGRELIDLARTNLRL